MYDSEARFKELIAALKARDFRLTPQRVELVRLVASSQEHLNAAQLYARIQVQFPTMSQATVYKTLALLAEMDQLQEIDLRGDRHYDASRRESHPHLICTRCSKIVDGEVEVPLPAFEVLEQASGFKISHSQVAFYGLCPDCRQGD